MEEKKRKKARRPLSPEMLDPEACDALIAAIYNRALKDYEMTFLKLKALEKQGAEESLMDVERTKLEELETFMLTGGEYEIAPETKDKIAKCFIAFRNILETM